MNIKYNGNLVEIVLDVGEGANITSPENPEIAGRPGVFVYNDVQKLNTLKVDQKWGSVSVNDAHDILKKVQEAFEYFKRCCEVFEKRIGNDKKQFIQIYMGTCKEGGVVKCSVNLKEYIEPKKSKVVCEGPEIIFDRETAISRYFLSLVGLYAMRKKYYETSSVFSYYCKEREELFDGKFTRSMSSVMPKSKVLAYENGCYVYDILSTLHSQIKGKASDIYMQYMETQAFRAIQNGTMSYLQADKCAVNMEAAVAKLQLHFDKPQN